MDLHGEIVEAGIALGGVISAAMIIYGRVKADKPLHGKGKVNKSVPLVIVAVIACSIPACALHSLSSHEKALAVGEEMSATYMSLYSEYRYLHSKLPPDGVRFLETKVAPVMDTAKRAIILYRSAAKTYARTQVKPWNMDALMNDVQAALADCAGLLSNAASYAGGDE